MVNWDGRNEQIIILGWDSVRSDLHLYTLHSVYLSSVLETSRTSIIFIIISQYRRGKKNHQTIYDVDMCCELDVCDQLRVKMTTSHLTEHRKKIVRVKWPGGTTRDIRRVSLPRSLRSIASSQSRVVIMVSVLARTRDWWHVNTRVWWCSDTCEDVTMTLGDNNTGDILDIDTDIDAIDQVSDKLVLAQLVCSSTNLIVIFIYWTYLLYASISRYIQLRFKGYKHIIEIN